MKRLKISTFCLLTLITVITCQSIIDQKTLLQEESLDLINLKTKSLKTYTKETLVRYSIKEEMVGSRKSKEKGFNSQEFSRISKTPFHLINRLNSLTSLQEFSLSFAIGGKNESYGHGSFFKAKFKKNSQKILDEEFIELGYIMSGMFQFAGVSVLEKERLVTEDDKSVLYWHSSPMEIFCVQHLSAFRKILRPGDLSAVEFLIENPILGNKFSSVEFRFKWNDGDKGTKEFGYYELEYIFESIYDRRILAKKLEYEIYTNIKKSSVNIINIGEKKDFTSNFKIDKKTKETKLTYLKLWNTANSGGMTSIPHSEPSYNCYRRELGRVNKPGRTLAIYVENNSKTKTFSQISLPFTSLQKVFISTLEVYDFNTKKKIEYNFEYKIFEKRQNINLGSPIQIDVKFSLEIGQKAILKIKVTLMPLLIRVIQWDSTWAFGTMTYSTLSLGLIYSSFAVWAASRRFQ